MTREAKVGDRAARRRQFLMEHKYVLADAEITEAQEIVDEYVRTRVSGIREEEE